MDVRTTAGEISGFRIVPAIAGDGFLLSPLIQNPGALAELVSDQWTRQLSNQKVQAIRIRIDRGFMMTTSYSPMISIEFSALQFPHQDLTNVPGMAAHRH